MSKMTLSVKRFGMFSFKNQGCKRMHENTTTRNYVIEPMQRIKGKFPKFSSVTDVFNDLHSNSAVFVQGGPNTPRILIEGMTRYAKSMSLKNIKIYQGHTLGPLAYLHPSCKNIFTVYTFYVTSNVRKFIAEGNADVIPILSCNIPAIFNKNKIKLDMCLIHVTPPDLHGFCSLGPTLGYTRSALINSKHRIALINKEVPRTYGDTAVHISHLDYVVETDTPMYVHGMHQPENIHLKIGALIAEKLIEDGSTLQIGLGNLINGVMRHLHGHKNLGIHSEVLADSFVELVRSGAVTNIDKPIDTGRSISTYLLGTKKLYDFVHNNPLHVMYNIDYVNNTNVIAKHPKVVAINSCLKIDLTGQVALDSKGEYMYAGPGGVPDFIRAAAQGTDMRGKPIITMTSTTSGGESKIVSKLAPGTGVNICGAQVHYVVTENGIAFLFGKSYKQRAHALIQLASPRYREQLEKEAFEYLKVMPGP